MKMKVEGALVKRVGATPYDSEINTLRHDK